MDIDLLIEILNVSVKNNGRDTPLTLGHFLNIIKMYKKIEENYDDRVAPEFMWEDWR
jgi:hypothetical protein